MSWNVGHSTKLENFGHQMLCLLCSTWLASTQIMYMGLGTTLKTLCRCWLFKGNRLLTAACLMKAVARINRVFIGSESWTKLLLGLQPNIGESGAKKRATATLLWAQINFQDRARPRWAAATSLISYPASGQLYTRVTIWSVSGT